MTVFRNSKRDLVPCGKCFFCLQRKRADWSFRLLQELKTATSACFLTLTYDDSSVPATGLCKRDLQLFFKRLRKFNSGKIRYYAVGEYGTLTERPHYHSIVFNYDRTIDFSKIWCKGHTFAGSVSAASIHYVTKYVINRFGDFKGRDPPFALMSRKPGIGFLYVDKMSAWHRDDDRMYVVNGGFKQALPRYYRDKIFSPFEISLLQFGADKESEKVYLEEIERLIKLGHSDPYAYYIERVEKNNDFGLKEINKFNKF